MIFGPVLAAALYAAQVATPPPEQPPPPPPSMGTSAAVWCPAKGACSEGVAIPVGSWRSIFRHGSGQLLFLIGSKSAGALRASWWAYWRSSHERPKAAARRAAHPQSHPVRHPTMGTIHRGS